MIMRLLLPATLALSLALLGGCESTGSKRQNQRKPGGWHAPAPTTDEPSSDAPPRRQTTNEDRGEPREKPQPAPDVQPRQPEPPVKTGEVPYAKGVAGKPGFVTSPFSPFAGYIDVRGFPPGTEVKDPYSGKTFLVP